MIELKNVSKSYNGETIFKNINIRISSPGLYGIIGASGCGKSTLLNIIGLMDNDYKGNYNYNSSLANTMNEETKSKCRFSDFSFIFQNPRLIDNESLKVNAELVLNRVVSNRELEVILKEYNLKLDPKTKLSALSGGEKQRFNLALVLSKNSKIILGDEVTSGLDEENKIEVLRILKDISRTKIVILVTHDVELLKKYTDKIYSFSNKTLPQIDEVGDITINNKLEKVSLKNKYILFHGLRVIRKKVFRTMFSLFSSVIALSCLGLCLILTSSMSDAIMNSLGNMINQNQIVCTKKGESLIQEEHIALDYESTKKIYNKYRSHATYLGAYYPNSLVSLFPDSNRFYFNINNQDISLFNYQIDDVINFEYILDNDETFFYATNLDLQEDEVILSLPRPIISRLCKAYGRDYNDDSDLLEIIKKKPLYLNIQLDNDSWDYHLSFSLKVVGYDVSNTPKLYHSTPLWNEYILESVLQLLVSYDLEAKDYYPWTTKKISYIGVEESKISNFIDLLIEESNEDYTFSIIKKDSFYYVYFYYTYDQNVRIKDIRNIVKENKELTTFIPGSENGYYVAKEALMSGFSLPLFLSNDYELIEEYIEYNYSCKEDLGLYQSTQMICTSNDLYSMSLFDSNKSNALKVKTYNSEDKKVVGRYPTNDKEIILSKDIANKLGIDENNFKERSMYIFGLSSVEPLGDEYINHFEIVPIKVVGVILEEGNFIYVDELWPISFLIINFDREEKDLYPTNIIFEYSGDNIKDEIKKLNNKYPDFTFSNPYLEYKDEVDNTLNYVTLGLSIFSGFCLISSLLMTMMSSYLFVSDNKREIGVYSYLGYSKKSIKRQFRFYGFFLAFYSAIISSFVLLVIITLLNSSYFGFKMPFKVNSIIPFIVIILVSFVLGILSSFFSMRKIMKENPINQLKEN